MAGFWLKWCKSHYRHDFCLKKAKELRAEGQRVKVGYTIKEYDSRTGQDEKYSRIYIWQEA